jgi:hypothetical protein
MALTELNYVENGSPEVARTIRPSSITASSEYSSAYVKAYAFNYNCTVNGWGPTSADNNPYIIADLGSAKDVKYITFGLVNSGDATSLSAVSDKTLDIYTSSDGNYSASPDVKQVMTYSGAVGHCVYAIPINKNVRYIKFLLEGSNHANMQGYKVEIYG